MNTKSKWIELRYVSPWTHEPAVCVLTSAKATGRWEGFKFAIFDKDSEVGAHVAFHPSVEEFLGSRTIDADEARKWVDAIYPRRKEIVDNFNKIYC